MNGLDHLYRDLGRLVDLLPEMVLTFLVGAVVIRVLIWLFDGALKVWNIKAGLRGILRTLASILLWISLFAIIFLTTPGLQRIGFYLSGSTALLLFVLSAGAAGLISDVIAGVMLSADRQFNIGWTVRAGDQGTEGKVVSMDIRKTRIEAEDGRLHVIPNALIEKNEWVVLDENKKGS